MLAALLIFPGIVFGQVAVDGLLPDTGGSGVPTVQTLAPVAGGAVAAMLAVPEKYAGSILEISGTGGAPNPKEWVLLAWNAENPGTLRKLVVSGDQLVSDTPSLSIYQAERKEVAIVLSSLGIDSGGVWKIAQAYASANKMTLGTIDFQLTGHANDVPPLWIAVCRDPSGKILGKLVILASTGGVQKSSGFPHAP